MCKAPIIRPSKLQGGGQGLFIFASDIWNEGTERVGKGRGNHGGRGRENKLPRWSRKCEAGNCS